MEISKKEATYLLNIVKSFDNLLQEVPLKVAKKTMTDLTRLNMTVLEYEELEKRMKECINGSNEVRK